MRECISHHFACDCREAEFAKLHAENVKLRETLEGAYAAMRHYCEHPEEVRAFMAGIAGVRAALKGGRDGE